MPIGHFFISDIYATGERYGQTVVFIDATAYNLAVRNHELNICKVKTCAINQDFCSVSLKPTNVSIKAHVCLLADGTSLPTGWQGICRLT